MQIGTEPNENMRPLCTMTHHARATSNGVCRFLSELRMILGVSARQRLFTHRGSVRHGRMSKRGSRSDTTFRLMPVNPKPPADCQASAEPRLMVRSLTDLWGTSLPTARSRRGIDHRCCVASPHHPTSAVVLGLA